MQSADVFYNHTQKTGIIVEWARYCLCWPALHLFRILFACIIQVCICHLFSPVLPLLPSCLIAASQRQQQQFWGSRTVHDQPASPHSFLLSIIVFWLCVCGSISCSGLSGIWVCFCVYLHHPHLCLYQFCIICFLKKIVEQVKLKQMCPVAVVAAKNSMEQTGDLRRLRMIILAATWQQR